MNRRDAEGKALMRAALAQPRMPAVPRVFLQVWEQSPVAIAVYASFGFEVVGRTTFHIRAGVAGDLVMCRQRGGS